MANIPHVSGLSETFIVEAIADGQAKLGGSNWELSRIIDMEIIIYNIGSGELPETIKIDISQLIETVVESVSEKQKRNYVNELIDSGISLTKLSKQTHISWKKLSAVSHGITKLKSSSKEYEILRNLNRKTAYNKLRESGMSPREANKYRRTGFSTQTYSHSSTRDVSHTKINKLMYQLKMLAEFINQKTHEARIIECFSKGHASLTE